MHKTVIPLIDIINFDSKDKVAKQQLITLFSQAQGYKLVHLKSGVENSLCIHYDASSISLATIKAQLITQGYTLPEKYQTLSLKVTNLDCSDCVTAIEHVLARTQGILSVFGSYASGGFRIEFDSDLIKAKTIEKKIVALGFTVNLLSTHDHAMQHEQDKKHAIHTHSHHGHTHDSGFWSKYRELGLSLITGLLWVLGLISHSLALPKLAMYIWLLAYLPGGITTLIDSSRALLQKRFNIESLMIFAAIGAGLLGKLNEGVLLLFLFSLGHALEHFALEKARGSIKSLTDMAPKKALLKLKDGTTYEVLANELVPGQTVIVKAGQIIPCDGVISFGFSNINQAAITGESLPVTKTVNDVVFAGTLNGEGLIEVLVNQLPQETTLAKMIRLVTEADTQKSPTQRFAEKFERIFVPIVLIGVVLIALIPYLLGLMSLHASIFMALIVLVSASPCALALATPVAILVGISRAAKEGILIKGGAALESLGQVQAIAFDKTGTLTQAKPKVVEMLSLGKHNLLDHLGLILGLEAGSAHPLALAIINYCQTLQIQAIQLTNLQNINGMGVQGIYATKLLKLGNRKLFTVIPDEVAKEVTRFEQLGYTVMIFAIEQEFIGLIAIADQVRPEAATTLRQLKQIGILKNIMLTGDNEVVAKAIGQAINIDEIKANLLPEDKVTQIKQLTNQHKITAMVGDGVNDAPAMANSSIGIAMGGTKTDVAIETSSIVLMNDKLDKLPLAISLSKATNKIIRQNLFISLGVVVALVVGGLLSITNIAFAVGIHEGSSLVVIFNALRLLYFKFKLE